MAMIAHIRIYISHTDTLHVCRVATHRRHPLWPQPRRPLTATPSFVAARPHRTLGCRPRKRQLCLC